MELTKHSGGNDVSSEEIQSVETKDLFGSGNLRPFHPHRLFCSIRRFQQAGREQASAARLHQQRGAF
jgi:hypothetical protein